MWRAASGVSRPAVWRWQRRYAEEGIEGLLRDKTRPPGTPPLPTATVAQVLALACSEPPGETTHWTGRAVAEVVGISLRSVQRIWQGHRLQPHRIRTFKRSNDPAFAEKVEDIVGRYMDPPSHAVVLSIDEKSQIQALDRTQPGLPMKPGKCGTMTHDYKRNGTITLFARAQRPRRRRHRPQHAATSPSGVHPLPRRDRAPSAGPARSSTSSSTTTPPTSIPRSAPGWARHPRWVFHFTPTSASWLNAVEGFLTRRRLKRGTFHSIVDLQAAINRYIDEHNNDPKPFVWTKSADTILAKLHRLPVPSV